MTIQTLFKIFKMFGLFDLFTKTNKSTTTHQSTTTDQSKDFNSAKSLVYTLENMNSRVKLDTFGKTVMTFYIKCKTQPDLSSVHNYSSGNNSSGNIVTILGGKYIRLGLDVDNEIEMRYAYSDKNNNPAKMEFEVLVVGI
jgi:hypothetical protein